MLVNRINLFNSSQVYMGISVSSETASIPRRVRKGVGKLPRYLASSEPKKPEPPPTRHPIPPEDQERIDKMNEEWEKNPPTRQDTPEPDNFPS